MNITFIFCLLQIMTSKKGDVTNSTPDTTVESKQLWRLRREGEGHLRRRDAVQSVVGR